MGELIFNTPWWVVAAICVGAISLLVSGNRRTEPRLKYAGLVMLALAGLLLLVSYLVETDREAVERRTRELVARAEEGDWFGFGALLHPNIEFSIYQEREEIVNTARQAADEIGLRTLQVTALESERTDGVITVRLTVRSEQDRGHEMPVSSSWLLEWLQSDDEWMLRRVTLTRLGQYDAEQILPGLPRP